MISEELTWTSLEQLGLSITHRQAAASGWGYRWRGRNLLHLLKESTPCRHLSQPFQNVTWMTSV